LRVVEAGVPGLVVCRSLVSGQPCDDGWQIAHVASGQVVAGNVWCRRADAAQAASTRLAPLADWTRTLPELAGLAEPHRPPMQPVTVQITARTSITPAGRTIVTGGGACPRVEPAWRSHAVSPPGEVASNLQPEGPDDRTEDKMKVGITARGAKNTGFPADAVLVAHPPHEELRRSIARLLEQLPVVVTDDGMPLLDGEFTLLDADPRAPQRHAPVSLPCWVTDWTAGRPPHFAPNLRCNHCGVSPAGWLRDERPGWGADAACEPCASTLRAVHELHAHLVAAARPIRYEQLTGKGAGA
jgi:hypothetical protein